MIAAQDLRIGNYLKVNPAIFEDEFISIEESSDILFKVSAIWGEDELSVIDEISGELFDEWRIAYCNPILLTEEWLFKFGFEKWIDRPGIGYTSWRIGEDMICEFEVLTLEDEYPFYQFGHQQLKYMHQLQNLYFALLKKELTLNE